MEVNPGCDNVRSVMGRVVSYLNGNEEDSINRLANFLDDSDINIRWQAAMLLSVSKGMVIQNIKNKVKNTLIETGDKLDHYRSRIETIKILQKIGGEDLAVIFRRFARFDNVSDVRLYAIKCIGILKIDNAQEDLMYLAGFDDNYSVRREAVNVLATTGKDVRQKKELLLKILKIDKEGSVRSQAILSLKNIYNTMGKTEKEEIEKGIILSMTLEDDNNVKSISIRTLGEIKSLAAVEHLLLFIDTEHNAYKLSEIVDALININDTRSVAPLNQLMEKLPKDEYPYTDMRKRIEEWLRLKN